MVEQIPTLLIIAGITLLAIGLLWYMGAKFLPLGKLPGDFSYEGKNFKFYFPLATSIILSILISIIFLIFRIFQKP